MNAYLRRKLQGNEVAPANELKGASRSAIKLLDATLVLSVATGIFYVCGYVFHEGFYGTLNVPMRALSLSTQDVLIFGSTPILLILLSVGAGFITMALLEVIGPLLKKIPKIGWLFDEPNSVPRVYMLGVWLIAIAFIYSGIIHWCSDRGKSEAKKFLAGDCYLTKVTYLDGGSSQSTERCFMVISGDAYWFKPVDANGKVSNAAKSFPVKSVMSTEVEGNLQDIRVRDKGRFKL